MKTFKRLKDLKNFLRLQVLGTYGEGLTYHDLLIDLDQITKAVLSNTDLFIVIRKTGTQGVYRSYSVAFNESLRWSNSEYIITVSYVNDTYRASSQKLHL